MRFQLVLLLVCGVFIAKAQDAKPKLSVDPGFCKLNYYLEGVEGDVDDEVDSIVGVKSCEAYSELIKARKLVNLQKSAIGVGAVMIIVPVLLYVLPDEKLEMKDSWPVMAGGAGIMLVSIPLTKGVKKHAGISVEAYNYMVQNACVDPGKMHIGAGVTNSGRFGIALNF